MMLVTKRKFAIGHLLVALLLSISARTQLPTAQTIASQMKVGWNLGNTLEAICGETVWGGATTTQQLINIRFIVGLRLIDWYVVMPPAFGPSNTVYCDIGRAPMMPLT